MLVNFNVQRPQQNFGMAIKFNKNASEYLQNRASKKTLAKLEELIKSEENKPDILLSREPNLGISGPGEVSTYGYYWEAKLMENENISASCSWFNAPIRAIKKVIKRRDFVGKYINTIKDSTIK